MKKLLFASLMTICACGAALAQSYPSKPVRLFVGFPAGGVDDFTARILAQRLNDTLGQIVVVDNSPGAAGIFAAQRLSKAAPDGYTIMLASRTSLVHSRFYPQPPYDSLMDFSPISMVATMPLLLSVHPSLPVQTMKDLISLAKAKPATVTCASSGQESISHLAMEVFRLQSGIQLVHIPYKGSGPALIDLLGGQVQMAFSTIVAVAPHLQSGRLRPLAVTSAKRMPTFPNVPTVAESTLAGFEFVNWSALVAPRGAPQIIISKLQGETAKILGQADVKERLLTQGAEPTASTADELRNVMLRDSEIIGKLIKACPGCCCGQTCGGMCLE